MSNYFMGIDPGASGGISLLQDGAPILAEKMPKTETEIWSIFANVRHFSRAPHTMFCFIEKVHSMPKQGVSSTFKFGRNYGFLRGCLIAAGIAFDEIPPQKWQKALGCMSKGDKNVTKGKAAQFFPEVRYVTHAIADSLLIAEYCHREKGGTDGDVVRGSKEVGNPFR